MGICFRRCSSKSLTRRREHQEVSRGEDLKLVVASRPQGAMESLRRALALSLKKFSIDIPPHTHPVLFCTRALGP